MERLCNRAHKSTAISSVEGAQGSPRLIYSFINIETLTRRSIGYFRTGSLDISRWIYFIVISSSLLDSLPAFIWVSYRVKWGEGGSELIWWLSSDWSHLRDLASKSLKRRLGELWSPWNRSAMIHCVIDWKTITEMIIN